MAFSMLRVQPLNRKLTSKSSQTALILNSTFRKRNNFRRPYTQNNGQYPLPCLPSQPASSLSWKTLALALALPVLSAIYVAVDESEAKSPKVDYAEVRKDIESLLDDPNYDDGSWGPVFIRLAWHAAGTFDKNSKTGGSVGGTMRFSPECDHAANAGLEKARERLEIVKKKHPGISYADLWSLAGVVAIEYMEGPEINWRPGRSDKPDGTHCPPDGRLPNATKGPDHVREVFGRMGFTDRETVALIGAHAVGRCHTDRSGFTGPWTNSPTIFSNDYFVQLLENKWTKKQWEGPEQYEDSSKNLMMLPADLALIEDPEFKKIVEIFAKDEATFFKEFAVAFQKLEELGMDFETKPWWKFW